jgi:thermitase
MKSKTNWQSHYFGKQLKKVGRGFLGFASIAIAFVAWGSLNSLSHSAISPASYGGAKKKISTDEQSDVPNDAQASSASSNGTSNAASNAASNILMNDPFIQNKWGLERTSARKAWEITQGSKDIVIAVIDTGADIHHKDLAENLWVNPGESGIVQSDYCLKQKNPVAVKECNRATNGIDDDGNGFVDDVHGWNFVQNDNSLTDNHGHGTHIAGIIAAKNGNGMGITGVAPNVSIMALKYYDPKVASTNNLKNTVNAIRYAIKMHANIINYSGGGTDYSAEEFAAVKDAERAGILFVAAAGNERSNSDENGKHYYPADYGLTNIISVTAVNKEETKVLPSSNYGVRTVDLAAPGENIYSTLPNNGYGFMTGTSQATAFVTGVAALVMSNNRDFSAFDVKKYILRTGDEYATLLSKTGTAKLLNSYKALTSLDKGVSATGVVATNTAKVGARAFASDQDIRKVKFDTSALGQSGAAEGDEPTESIASFGRDFMKAVKNEK